MPDYDVIVVGAGNAALAAAVSAREQGATRVVALEKAPRALRGGNTHYSGGLLRIAFDGAGDLRALVPDAEQLVPGFYADVEPYPQKLFMSDLRRVTDGRADPELAELLIGRSYETARWMVRHGIEMEPAVSLSAVKVGDTIRVHLKNPATATLAHSIDFHASQVAWNDEMTSINQGEEKVYEWEADYAGVWMYHCGTNPALHHIANGMYGMVIVEHAEGLPKVDAEFALVQNEWYLGPQGEPVSLAKAGAAAPAPDYIAFNGVAASMARTRDGKLKFRNKRAEAVWKFREALDPKLRGRS